MWRWVLPVTVAVIVTGVAIMFAWTAVNQLLAGHGAAVNWPQTILAVLVILLAAGAFVAFVNKLALVADQEPDSH